MRMPSAAVRTPTREILVLCVILLANPSLWADAQVSEQANRVALNHVTIIDVTSGRLTEDVTVVLADGRISDIGKAGAVKPPQGTPSVDATNRFLIPGLWDMHVHIAGRYCLPLFVANGVTGVRDMHSSDPDSVLRMRAEVKTGQTLGPRIQMACMLVDGVNPFWRGSMVAANEEEGRKAVQSLKKRGADFIKVYSKLSRSAYLGIAAEAKKEGLPFAGHVPESIDAGEASDVGQKSMEHLYGIALACSTDEETLRKQEVEGLAKLSPRAAHSLTLRTQIKAADSFSEQKARKLFARFIRNGTWQVPTLTMLRGLASIADATLLGDSRLKYMPAYLRWVWNPNSGATDLSPENVAAEKRVYEDACKLLRKMHAAGVPVLAGTDTTNPFCFPGFSLHDELGLLVDAGGFTPLEALQCATLSPARYFGMEKELGSVEKGKIADLVLLQGNPLEDIHNTTKIAAVFLRGKLLARPQLERMLAEVEAAHKK
jgi:imidazolonepropionase-like amidohydrolase